MILRFPPRSIEYGDNAGASGTEQLGAAVMEHRWTNLVISLFWLSTMTWLMVEKVLPPLRRGDPPSFRSVYADLDASVAPISWDVTWNNSPIGWAMSVPTHPTTGMTEIRSHVHFSRIPVEEMAPVWMRGFVHDAVAPLGKQIHMDAYSRMEIDPLNRLTGFRSSIRVGDIPEEIVMEGTIEGSQLKLRVDAGGANYSTERYMPRDALIGDELSPQARMPGLHLGQVWTVPVYNPLRPPDSPMEILQASVEGRETLMWNGSGVNTLLVVYRSDSGSTYGASRAPRGKMWVDDSGTVLRQEMDLLGSKLAFVRLPAEQRVRRSSDANGDAWQRAFRRHIEEMSRDSGGDW
jgi:hypothetical protein